MGLIFFRQPRKPEEKEKSVKMFGKEIGKIENTERVYTDADVDRLVFNLENNPNFLDDDPHPENNLPADHNGYMYFSFQCFFA